jgi:PTH1 family peptidyl-tRNA hydrolase
VYLIVGLGNPGKKYERHRHNVGFMTVERLRAEQGLPAWKEKFSGVFSRGSAFGVGGSAAGGTSRTPGVDLVLLEPMTFMNASGDSVQPAAAFVKVDPAHIVVVHDELDLPFAEVRIKLGGGHAGHNGLRSIIERLGTPDFVRVRVGIGRPAAGFTGDIADYVLSSFDAVEAATLPDVLERAIAAVRAIVEKGPSAAQNLVNTRK